MTANGWIQIAIYCAIVTLLVKPFGGYMNGFSRANEPFFPRSCGRSSAASTQSAASMRSRSSTG